MNSNITVSDPYCACGADYSSSCCLLFNCSSTLGCRECHRGVIDSTSVPGKTICRRNYFLPLNCTGNVSNAYVAAHTYPEDLCYNNATKCKLSGGRNSTVTSTSGNTCSGYPANTGTSCTSSQTFCQNNCNGSYIYKFVGDQYVFKGCGATLGIGCCAKYNCSTPAGCGKCNKGVFDNSSFPPTCYAQYYYPDCYATHNNCSNKANCTACNYTWINLTQTNITYCYFDNIPNPGNSFTTSVSYLPINCATKSSFTPITDNPNCIKACDGQILGCQIYSNTTKLKSVMSANLNLSSLLFNTNPDNRMAVVAYNDNIFNYTQLTFDKTFITKFISSLTAKNYTNICLAIKFSSQLFDLPNRFKAIILMTDGVSNAYCNGTISQNYSTDQNLKNEEIIIAKNIYQTEGIRIYTIGFAKNESSVDNDTLKKIANVTNGTYRFSNISDLANIYNQTITQMMNDSQNFYIQNRWNWLEFYVYGENGVCKTIVSEDIPNPMETRSYKILTCGNYNISKIEVYLVAKDSYGNEERNLLETMPGTSIPKPISITSPEFVDDAKLPDYYIYDNWKYSNDGIKHSSPILQLSNIPNDAKSLVMLMEDPVPDPVHTEIPRYFYWSIWDIPVTTKLFNESYVYISGTCDKDSSGYCIIHNKISGIEGKTDTFKSSSQISSDGKYIASEGYEHPKNNIVSHDYIFHIFALDESSLNLPQSSTPEDVLAAINGHVILSGRLTAHYP